MSQTEKSGTRIMICEPVPAGRPEPPHRPWWRETVKRLAKPGTTLDCVDIKKGYVGLGPYEQSYNAMQMVERGYEAEVKGYDAFIIGCATDGGLREARGLLNIPVAGPTEACSIIASTMGERFSIIDLQPFTRPVIESAVRNAGLIDKLASVRSPAGLTAGKSFQMAFGGQEDALADLLIKEMENAINQDGAEALFVSCIVTSAILTKRGVYEVQGVPVIDQLGASIKMVELFLDWKKAFGTGVCKKSIYRAPPPNWADRVPIKFD